MCCCVLMDNVTIHYNVDKCPVIATMSMVVIRAIVKL